MAEYYSPRTIGEALQLLAEHRGEARVIAGGTDLYLDMARGKRRPVCLVDIRGIAPLRALYEEGGQVFIGAAVTHAELSENPLIREKFPALAKGASVVGGPQIRNIGTIGGNVVNGQPAADTAIPLLALDATAVVAELDGTEKRLPFSALHLGPGRSAIDGSRQLLKGFWLPSGAFPVSDFSRVARRKALALPVLNAAVALKIVGGAVQACRLAAGPIGPVPRRLEAAEALLNGQALSLELCEQAAQAAAGEAAPRDSRLRGTADYRKKALGIMVKRLLAQYCI